MHPATQGIIAHTPNAIDVHPLFTVDIDRHISPDDHTDDDRAEFRRMALHQAAYNDLSRARHALLHFSTDYAGAIASAESAIAAMAALALMNGRA